MALITCPECEKKISENADSCPNCGYKLIPEKLAEIKKEEQRAHKSRNIGCLVLILIILVMIGYFSSNSPKDSPRSIEDETFHKKYVLVKSLDDTTFKMGVFDKVEIGTSDRVEITLDMRNVTAYNLALKFMPQFKEVGFKVLRLKHNGFDRYEDYNIE